jgi:hypothetical protein
MTISNDLGQVVFDPASVGTGPLAPVNGGHVFHNPMTFMNTDHNIRVKADNQTTTHHLTNVTSASGSYRSRVQDKSAITVFTTNRGNINPAMETQLNLKGNVNTKQFTFLDGAKTTTKQTTLFNWNGGVTSNVPNQMTQSHYTTKDGSGGVTSIPTNKNPIIGYIPGGSRVTGNMTQVSPGEVNFKEMDNDRIRTEGGGTLHQAVPELSRINPILKEHTGRVQFNPNRTRQEDHTRTECCLVDGLLTNGFSIYNNGKKDELIYPSFMSDSKPADYSPYKTTSIKKEEIPERDIPRAIPVHNSRRNGNEVIVRNVTGGNIENPLLFTKRELICSPSLHGKCYAGDINNSDVATYAFTKDIARYAQPPA